MVVRARVNLKNSAKTGMRVTNYVSFDVIDINSNPALLGLQVPASSALLSQTLFLSHFHLLLILVVFFSINFHSLLHTLSFLLSRLDSP